MCLSVYLSMCVFFVFRIVNETSTEASLAPGIDQLYSTNSWQGVHKVHKVVQLGLSHEVACCLFNLFAIRDLKGENCLKNSQV